MSSLKEIEQAISHLNGREFGKLMSWLEEYQATVVASALVFEQLDADENEEESQWLGHE